MPLNYQYDKKRFEAFIDAIIAILLTILVIEIKIPEHIKESHSTVEQVKLLVPVLVSYIATFLLIAGF